MLRLRYSAMGRCVGWQMITRVSEEPAASILRSQEGKSEMSVINDQTTLYHTPEDHSLELDYLSMNATQISLFLL
jgi:hypothetical protein